MPDTPLVSVLMTCYNREKYIAEAIESVLASSYKNFELIISDDVSTDKTVSIARSFALKDNRVSVFVNESNLGDYKNRNMVASYAKGKFIKYLDSDDIIYPWGLEAMVSCMQQFPKAGYGLISYGLPQGIRYPLILASEQAYYSFFFKGSMIITGPSGAIIRTDVFRKVNGFSGKQFIGDTELWLNLSMKYSLVAMPLDLIWWRQHEGQQMREEKRDNKVEIDRYHLYKNALESRDCPLSDKYSRIALRNLKNLKARNILKYLVTGKIKKALYLYKGFQFSPLDIILSFRFNKYPQVYN
jgi:glycosyltransferase involved in cell wall biosynthesis